MKKREIIMLIIVGIMVLLNVVGTVWVVVANITTGRDLVQECLCAIFPNPPMFVNEEFEIQEKWTLPTSPPTTIEKAIPEPEPTKDFVVEETIPQIEPPIETITEEAEQLDTTEYSNNESSVDQLPFETIGDIEAVG